MMDATEPPPKGMQYKTGKALNVPGTEDVEMRPKARPMNASASPSLKNSAPVGMISSQYRTSLLEDHLKPPMLVADKSFDRSSTSTSNERAPMCPFQALAMAIEASNGGISPHRTRSGEDPHMGFSAKHEKSAFLDGMKGIGDDPAFGRLASAGSGSNVASNALRPSGSVHSSRSGGTGTHGTGSNRDPSVTHGSSSQDNSKKKFQGGIYRGHVKKKKMAVFSKSSTPPFDDVALKIHAPLIKESWMLAMSKASFSELGCIYYDTLFEESQVSVC